MKTVNFNVAISRSAYPKLESKSAEDIIYQIKLYSIYVRYYSSNKQWKPRHYWTALHRYILNMHGHPWEIISHDDASPF